MNLFDFSFTNIEGLAQVMRKTPQDHRGAFSKIYCDEEFSVSKLDFQVKQVNCSYTSKKGTIRGLHYQVPPHAEKKLVTCTKGKIFDVVVDLRAHSPTFLFWYSDLLSSENNRALMIPEGCCHGFQTLTDDCEVLYLHSKSYRPEAEAGVNIFDPKIEIQWPCPVTGMSEKDRAHPLLPENFEGILL